MTVILKPYLNIVDTFSSGQMVFSAPEIEVSDTLIGKFINSIKHTRAGIYENKYTGFETVKYTIRDTFVDKFNITLSGDCTYQLTELLRRMAIAINGAGMAVVFNDIWCTNAPGDPVGYYCKWTNAGDFIENSAIRSGGSIELITFNPDNDVVIAGFQKVISNSYEWVNNVTNSNELIRIV